MTWACGEGCAEQQCESGLYTYIVADTGVPGGFIHYLKYNIPGCDGSTEGDVAISYIPSFFVDNNGDFTYNVPPRDQDGVVDRHYHIHQVCHVVQHVVCSTFFLCEHKFIFVSLLLPGLLSGRGDIYGRGAGGWVC